MTHSLVVAALAFAVAAGTRVMAQQALEMVACGDVAAALQQREPEGPRSRTPIDRLARLANGYFRAEAPPERGERVLTDIDFYPRRGGVFLVSGPRNHVDQLQALVAQLRRPEVRELRVQCTLLHLPMSIAEQHGLAPGRATAVDEVLAGKVQKAAVQARGRLQNLPELAIAPLEPFRTEPPSADQDGLAKQTLPRLRGEAALVSDDEALFGVQLVAGELPADPTRLPKAPLANATFRLRSGSGVILLANAPTPGAPVPLGGATAPPPMTVALWLRFVEVAEPRVAPLAAPRRPDPDK